MTSIITSGELSKKKKCNLFRINGMEEYLHLLTDLHPSIALADFIRDIKTATSFWIQENKVFPRFNRWGTGYCALTYCNPIPGTFAPGLSGFTAFSDRDILL
ncbi:transposase [Marinilabilia rubra]|uniref:Transposase IS200-like domain-containing protein n=1 Tax=Marinilabilia rubra TaxID=2162893 RepID=A0A2U2B8D7_9BACT|nr:transposase [Marinilabilia rubra]PWD99312.1 hypothetical protein DDZ16_12020 [Marinilabilia rubra]